MTNEEMRRQIYKQASEMKEPSTCVRCGLFVSDGQYRCEKCEILGVCQECERYKKALEKIATDMPEHMIQNHDAREQIYLARAALGK